jgi:hypothetical protein
MRLLTLPDLHGKTVWRQLDPAAYDRLVFLGDYVGIEEHYPRRLTTLSGTVGEHPPQNRLTGAIWVGLGFFITIGSCVSRMT